MNNEIRLSIYVDGKESESVLRLTDDQVKKLLLSTETLGREFPEKFNKITSELKRFELATEDSVQELMNFINAEKLTSSEIESTLGSLKREASTLAINSAEYKKNQTAILNLTTAYDKLVDEQSQTVHTNRSLVGSSANLNTTFGQLGWVIGDASMFAVNFRMGMMSIGNNIPMVVQELMRVKESIQGTNTSMKSLVLEAIKGPGGIMLAINGVMLLLQILPGLFDDTTKSVEDQKQAVDQLKNSYERLTQAEVEERLLKYNEQLAELEQKAKPKTMIIRESTDIVSGLGPAGGQSFNKGKEKIVELSDKERYGDNFTMVQELQNRVKALSEINDRLGVNLNFQNQISRNQEKLLQLSDDANKSTFWKNIVPDAQSFIDAQNKIRQWIERDQQILNPTKKTLSDASGLLSSLDSQIKKLEEKKNLSQTSEEIAEIEKQIEALTKEKNKIELEVVLKKYGVDDISIGKEDITLKKADTIKRDTKNDVPKQLQKKQTIDDVPELKELQINQTKSGLDKELALNEHYRKLELEQYKNVVGAKSLIDKKYNEKKEEIEKQYLLIQLQNVGQTLGMLSGLLNQHSAEGKLVSAVMAGINTYEGATKALAQGGFWGIAQMALVIAAGLKQVDKILSTDVPQYSDKKAVGFARGGKFPAGTTGFIEGWHNEIIAPEKSFIEVFQNELKPQIYNGLNLGRDDTAIVGAINNLGNDIKELQNRPSYISEKLARKIFNEGLKHNNKIRD